MIEWLEKHMIPCPIYQITGQECPGCGMQRSIIELLKGNFIQSVENYPALIPLIIMFTFLVLHIKFNFKNGAKTLKYLFILSSIIILTNYLIKII